MKRKTQSPSEKTRLFPIVLLGILLLILVIVLMGRYEFSLSEEMMQATMDTLRQQSISYNKLMTADRTKSLFRLADCVIELSRHLEDDPHLANDAYLEESADRMSLSGLALLDGQLHLEASGYTRELIRPDWKDTFDDGRFESIALHAQEVYIERIEVDGQYYDVCAVSRRDAPGVLVGYYAQPKKLMQDMEEDLESLLGGLHMERGGNFLITKNGRILASGNSTQARTLGVETDFADALDALPSSDRLHFFFNDGAAYYGARTVCEGYGLYIYYPLSEMFTTTFTGTVLYILLYILFWLVNIELKNRSLREKQRELIVSNSELQKTVDILHSLEGVYFSIFYVDIRRCRYESIILAPWMYRTVAEEGAYTDLLQTFFKTAVLEEYREEMWEKFNIDAIRESLSRDKLDLARNSFYMDYRARRGAEVKWCSIMAIRVDTDSDGAPAHALLVMQDIDEEKSKEQLYQQQIIAEAEAARYANIAKTDFLRRISHDIRTPINGIQGYINMASRYPDDAQKQAMCREKTSLALGYLLDLVNNVLDMSRMESGQIALEDKPFELRALLREANAVIENQAAEQGIRYLVMTDDALPELHLRGSALHIRQILLNLAGNAVKYGRQDGEIRVKTRIVARKGETLIVEFTCADNGIGMSEEFQEHLFEPFTQEANDARSRYRGSGLGLSIVKRLIDAMHGTITFHSRKGIGTTFTVTLPLRIDEHYVEPLIREIPESKERELSGLRALLIEDNELNMEIAQFLLEEHGAQVETAWNGREGVDLFAIRGAGYYDFILMDIMMPVMNGTEATCAIRSLDRSDAQSIPIIAMSANAFADDVQKSLDAGMNAHLSKPVDEHNMIRVIREHVKGDGSAKPGKSTI